MYADWRNHDKRILEEKLFYDMVGAGGLADHKRRAADGADLVYHIFDKLCGGAVAGVHHCVFAAGGAGAFYRGADRPVEPQNDHDRVGSFYCRGCGCAGGCGQLWGDPRLGRDACPGGAERWHGVPYAVAFRCDAADCAGGLPDKICGILAVADKRQPDHQPCDCCGAVCKLDTAANHIAGHHRRCGCERDGGCDQDTGAEKARKTGGETAFAAGDGAGPASALCAKRAFLPDVDRDALYGGVYADQRTVPVDEP